MVFNIVHDKIDNWVSFSKSPSSILAQDPYSSTIVDPDLIDKYLCIIPFGSESFSKKNKSRSLRYHYGDDKFVLIDTDFSYIPHRLACINHTNICSPILIVTSFLIKENHDVNLDLSVYDTIDTTDIMKDKEIQYLTKISKNGAQLNLV